MRKILTIGFLISLSLSLSAQSDMGYLGVGLVSDLNSEVRFQDNTKINLFLGWATPLLKPLPLYLGFEGLLGVQKIGEDSSVSYYYRDQLIVDGYNQWTYIGTINKEEMKTTFWDMDFSPRVTASLVLDPIPVYATAYLGLNMNWVNMHWEYTDEGDESLNKQGDETLSSSPLQVVTGLRVTAWIIYAEYTKFFDIVEGDVNFGNSASNRLSIGAILKF